jgi:hypothetical protein
VSGVNVQRFVYVPEAGRDFARYLDVIVNPSIEAQDVTVRYRCNLGSDGEETGYGSDGDASPETTDTWIASDDEDGAGDPSLAILVQNEDAPVGLARWVSTPGSGSIDFEFSLSIPSAGTQALMTFVVQAGDRSSSYDTATWLESMPPEATAGLDRELDDVQNLVDGGVPSLNMGGPYAVAEGGSIELLATWYDVDGDDVTVAWDLDASGDYEAPGERVVFDAANKDGPAVPPFEVGVQATDGTHTTERRGIVEVVNVPPALGISPDLETVVGFPWEHRLVVVDPSPIDTVTATLVPPIPVGATLEGTTIHWTPDEVGVEVFHVHLADDDGGETLTDVTVTVRDDSAPPGPRLLAPDDGAIVDLTRPTLTFGSVTDPDGDPLEYQVEVRMDPTDARGPCDDGEEEIVEPGLVADASGNTSFTPDLDHRLCRDRRYVWTVLAFDGWVYSEGETRGFEVDAHALDEPPSTGEPPAGCACRSLPDGASGAFAAFAIIGVLLAPRRANGIGKCTHGRRE